MTRWLRTFGEFCYDFVIGDDWRVAVAVVAALAVTYGVATLSIAAWWVLPVAVMIVLPLSLWRVARASRPSSSGQ
jgi:uncharacterized membrane protein YfhO